MTDSKPHLTLNAIHHNRKQKFQKNKKITASPRIKKIQLQIAHLVCKDTVSTVHSISQNRTINTCSFPEHSVSACEGNNHSHRPTIKFRRGTTEIQFIIDSGADLSLLSTSDYKELGSPKLDESHVAAGSCNNSDIKIIGQLMLDLSIANVTKTVNFQVASDIRNSLFGIDAIRAFSMVIHPNGYTLTSLLKEKLPSEKDGSNLVSLIRQTIKAGNIRTIPVKGFGVRGAGDKLVNAFEKRKDKLEIYQGAYHFDQHGETNVLIANCGVNDVMIQRDETLASFEDLQCIKPIVNATYDNPVEDNVEIWKSDDQQFDVPLDTVKERDHYIRIPEPKSDKLIPINQIQNKICFGEFAVGNTMRALIGLIEKHHFAFSRANYDIGNFTEWDEHLTQKPGTRPVFSKQYPIAESRHRLLPIG